MEKSADAFRTISEVADDLTLPQHVLRFWETRFSQIRPLKRAGGRRYYRPADVALLKTIRQLLYDDGYTIKGVQRLLKEQGQKTLVDQAPAEAFEPSLEEEPVELQTLSFGEPVRDDPFDDDERFVPDEPSREEASSQSRVVAIYESRPLGPGNATSSPAYGAREIGREALIEAITTIDECLRILAVARRATT